MPEDYNGPSGAFAEMVAVEQQVRGTATPESTEKLAKMGVQADAKSNLKVEPEYRREARRLEIDQLINALLEAKPIVQKLQKLIDENPALKAFFDLKVSVPHYSPDSGNKFGPDAVQRIEAAVDG